LLPLKTFGHAENRVDPATSEFAIFHITWRVMIEVLLFLFLVIRRNLDHHELDRLVQNHEVPLVVRFCSEHRPRSVQLNLDWSRFEQMYELTPSVLIGHVNCGRSPRLCLRETVWDPPAVRLYLNHSIFPYSGGMSYESLAEWTRRITGTQGKFLHLDLLSPNNRTFHDLLESRKCVFVMFHTPWCRRCLGFMESMRSLAKVFRSDNVSVCEVDADKFKSFFFDFKLREFQAFRLFANRQVLKYDGPIDTPSIIDFLNDHCETQRAELGELSSEVGVLDELTEAVEDFLHSRDPKFLLYVKRMDGAGIYGEIMSGILENGTDWIGAECQRLQSIVRGGSASQDSLDRLQKRLNVLNVFLNFLKFQAAEGE
jgi:thioredoxin-like negative regulator of GroEL